MSGTRSTLGRSEGEIVAEQTADLTVRGVELPGDTGVFVRDDALAGACETNPAVAAWRSVQEAVAVTVWPISSSPDGTPASGTRYVADIRRWDHKAGRWRHAEILVADVELERLPQLLRGAMTAASDTTVHTFEQLCTYAEQVCGPTGDRGWGR